MAVNKFILFGLFLILIQGCATKIRPLPPSEFLLYTEKAQTESLADLAKSLKENKYEVSRFDYVTGIMSTKPRAFNVSSRWGSAKGEQTVLVRQESGSMKLRFQYQCDYPIKEKPAQWGSCDIDDDGTIDKIERLENILLPLVAEAIHKKSPGKEKPALNLSSQVRGYR